MSIAARMMAFYRGAFAHGGQGIAMVTSQPLAGMRIDLDVNEAIVIIQVLGIIERHVSFLISASHFIPF